MDNEKEISLTEMKNRVRGAQVDAGSMEELGFNIGVSATYLYEILKHDKKTVSDKIAKYLGFERVLTATYRPIKR